MIKKAIGIYAVSMISILGMEQQERKVENENQIYSMTTVTIENNARTIKSTTILEKRTPYSRTPQYNHEPRKLTQQNIAKTPEQFEEFKRYIEHAFLQHKYDQTQIRKFTRHNFFSYKKNYDIILDTPGMVAQRKQYSEIVKMKMSEMKSKKEDLQNTDPFLAPPKILPAPPPHLFEQLSQVAHRDEKD